MKRRCCWILVILSLLISSCDLPHQPGPMPSEIVETAFEPGLNVLGVLRADGERGSSFININRALTTEEIYSDTILNFSPEVDHVRVHELVSGDEYLFTRETDSSDWNNYTDSTLLVTPGEAYALEVNAPGFPLLSANTIVPAHPQLGENTLMKDGNRITFQIQYDPSAYEYAAYLIFTEDVLEKRIKPGENTMIDIDWSYASTQGSPLVLMLAALDENLTRYGNSPISFIPNTFHPDGSTVSGGYGCFGSVAITWVDLTPLN